MSLSLSQGQKVQPDWSALPSDGLGEISRRLLSWHDYFHFRSVCASWRSAAPKRPRLPLLLVVTSGMSAHPLTLCNFPDTELYTPPLTKTTTTGWGYLTRGSSRGWICVDCMMYRSPIFLQNPITGVRIYLPLLPDQARPRKLVLSSDPAREPHNCVVLANCCNRSVFYCRPGDASWTLALNNYNNSDGDATNDVIFYKGKAYVVTKLYRLFSCHIGVDNACFAEILPADPMFSGGKPVHTGEDTKTYLVVSSGDLLLVAVAFTRYSPSGFEVFRVDLDGGQLRLLKLQNLGGRALFLSHWSMALSVEISPATNGCKGNSIYYLYTSIIGTHVKVFNMEDSSIGDFNDVWWPFMVWLTPSPY